MGFLKDTKLTQGIHTWNGTRYYVLVMEEEIQHRGGVVVIWRAAKGWQVEGMANFGPNMDRFLPTSVARRWYVVGEYVPPNNVPAMHRVEQALRTAPKGIEIILTG